MAFSLSHIFAKESRSAVGVDIGSSAIKVVQLRREKGRAILETYGAIALGPYAGVEIGRATQLTTERIVDALSTIIKEANVTSADAGFAIPYSSSLLAVVRLPAAVEKHLDETMPLEARKYIPVPINEVKLDWSLLTPPGKGSEQNAGKIEVMLVAIHNDTIERYRRIASDAGLLLSFFEIEVFSTVRASLEHGIAPVAIVDFGAATTKLYVVERGIIRESHVVNHGSQELTLNAARALNISVALAEERKRKEGMREAVVAEGASFPAATPGSKESNYAQSFELSLGPLMLEISHAIAAYEQRVQESIGTIVFTGGGSTLKGFGAYAQSKLQAEVHLADPFGKTEAPAFLADILKEAGPEFSVAVGLALRRLQELG